MSVVDSVGLKPVDASVLTADGRALAVPPGRDPLSFLYNEFRRLQDEGRAPDPDAYCTCYPELQAALRQLISVEEMLNAKPELVKSPEAPWPEIGACFVGFQLQRELGRGAFARVYLAREPALGDRTVVVKVSNWGAAEALTLGRLAHANIVPVYSVRTDERTHRSAVCMPYLGEATLGDVLGRVRSSRPRRAQVILEAAGRGQAAGVTAAAPEAAATETFLRRASYADGIRRLAIQLLDALDFMHREGVYHRDLKPSNVLLTRFGVPMLLDFNLSADNRQKLKEPGGTPAYTPPEQLRLLGQDEPDARHLDGRSDLFALGVILYELLAGRHPFELPDGAVHLRQAQQLLLHQHAAGARPLRAVNSAVPPDLAELVDRCLAYEPQRRPASAAAARALLAEPKSQPGPLERVVTRRPRLSVACGALALAISLGLVAALRTPSPSALELAGQAYRAGEYQAAVEQFTQHLAAAPLERAALVRRGVAYLHLQNYALAVSDLDHAQQLQADGATAACLGYAFQLSKNHQQASVVYEQAVAAGYQTAAVYNNLGYALLRVKLLTKAEAALSRAVQLDPELSAAYHNRGNLYLIDAMVHSRAHTSPAGGSRENYRSLLLRAVTDLRLAVAKGPPAGELYQHTAEACARLVALQESNQAEPALIYLNLALQHGADASIRERWPFRAVLATHPGDRAVNLQPVAASAFSARRLVPIVLD